MVQEWKTRNLEYKELKKGKCRDTILVFNAQNSENDKYVFKKLHSSKFSDNYMFKDTTRPKKT